MPLSRMMGAGSASSTVYNTNVNLNTFGGSKKQGITSRVGLGPWANTAVQQYSNGYGRTHLFCMNQLGGVGAGRSMFNGRFTQTDGTNCRSVPDGTNATHSHSLQDVINESHLLAGVAPTELQVIQYDGTDVKWTTHGLQSVLDTENTATHSIFLEGATALLNLANATDLSTVEPAKVKVSSLEDTDTAYSELTKSSLSLSADSNTKTTTYGMNTITMGNTVTGTSGMYQPCNLLLESGTTNGKVTLTSVAQELTLENTFSGAKTEVKVGGVSSSANLTLDAGADLTLSAGEDTLKFTADAMLSTSVGGSTDQYLVVTINGTTYRISLLASP